jgi:hypothetical protein
MSEKAMEIVNNMSDVEVVRFLEHFGKQLFEGTTPEVVMNSVTPELKDLAELKKIDALDGETRKRRLEPTDSARIARVTLEQMAQDDGLSDALVKSWEEYDPQELFVEMILAVGLVASMILLVSTTEIELEFKGVKIKKGKATADQIKAIAEPLFKAVGQIT